MKKLLAALIFFPALACANGPLYKVKDVIAQQEFDNVYQDMKRLVVSSNTLPAGSTQYIQNKAADGTLQTPSVINVDSGTVTGQFRVYNAGNSVQIIETSGNGVSPVLRFKNRAGGITNPPEVGMENDTGGGSGRYGAAASSLVFATFSTHPITAITNSVIRWKADESGNILQPTQPSFLVTNSTGSTDITGDGTNWKASFGNVIYDQTSGFSLVTNTFTAQVTGRYYFDAGIIMEILLATHLGRQIRITTSNRLYVYEEDFSGTAQAYPFKSFNIAVVADMDANDTTTINIVAGSGTKTVDIEPSALFNFFSGSLIN